MNSEIEQPPIEMQENKCISIFQIYYDEATRKHIDPKLIPYFNEKKDNFFENSVIKEIYKRNIQSEYIGITSWKQKLKTRITGKDIIDCIELDIKKGEAKDVYLFPPIWHCENGIIKCMDVWQNHRASGQAWDADIMLNNANVLPFDLFKNKWVFAYCNYWVARKQVFDEYCEKVLLPAIDFFSQESLSFIFDTMTHSHEGKQYPVYPFTLEALFGCFLANANYSYKWLRKKKYWKGTFKWETIHAYEPMK